jgi:hypothetical protein
MKNTLMIAALALMSIAGGACAGGGVSAGPSGSATGERVTPDAGTVLNQDIGRVELAIFTAALEKVVIGKYKFSLRRREEQFQSLYYETLWVLRPPTEEEREVGTLEARHRIVIQGRRAGSGALRGSAVTYRMNLKIENQARTRDNSDWHEADLLGGTVEEEMRRMVSDFQLEVRTGRTR